MVEKIKYKVVKKMDKVEIRHYPNIVIARVDRQDDSGFNILFRFISGHNKQKRSIEMTAPVISERIEMTAPVLSDTNSIAFVMPKEYTLNTTPTPLDNRVKIEEIPERSLAVLRFSGRWSDSIFSARSEELMEELAKSEIKTKSSVFVMRYSGPYMPWFLRRNEVAVEVEIDT